MHLLEMKNIRKTFPGVVAVDDVSITLDRGEVLALLGENGAGKSTLIKVLAGVHSKDEGEILIDGRTCRIDSPVDALNEGIAVIYQELCLANDMTVSENIFMGRELRNRFGFLDKRRMEEESQRILDSLGVEFPASAVLRSLSIAQKQTVEIAKCISRNAKIIIMDEPTSSLTSNEVRMLFTLIGKLKSEGIGMIYISHRMEELFEICDRVTVLRDGRSVGTKVIRETNRDELVSMMVGRTLSHYYVKDDNVQDEVVLEVKDLVSYASPHPASFFLRKGEILGFSGLVGAGRSELMKTIFGAARRLSGKVFINGHEADIRSPSDAIAHDLAMISEERHREGLVLRNTVSFNVSLLVLRQFISHLHVDQRKEDEIVKKQIDDLAIRVSGLNQMAVNLSGGNQQKVVLAKWLTRTPSIIIMDEPTRGIDVSAKAEIYSIMNSLTAKGCSIIMVSSELPEIIGMCDRVVVMSEGAMTAVLERKDLTQETLMHYALLTPGTKEEKANA